jgi:hypothetical protein
MEMEHSTAHITECQQDKWLRATTIIGAITEAEKIG